MIDRELIVNLTNAILEGTSFFLVDVSVSATNEIEVEIDSSERVSIDNCCDISRSLEEKLDRDKEDFSLTVLSAGIGYPFKVFPQYKKTVGKMVEVKFKNGTKLNGTLISCSQVDGKIMVTVAYDKKEKNEGDKRPHMVHHEDNIEVIDGMSVKEIITIR